MSLAQVSRHWARLKAFVEADQLAGGGGGGGGGSADASMVMDESMEMGSPPMSPATASMASTPLPGGGATPQSAAAGGVSKPHAAAAPPPSFEWHTAEKVLLQEALATSTLGVGPFKAKIAGILSKLSQEPLGHYMRHLYAVHTGDFTSALNGLHHFFDMQAPRAIVRRQAADGSIIRTRRVNFHYSALSQSKI